MNTHSGPMHPGCPLTTADLDAATKRFSRILQFETVSDRNVPTHALQPDHFKKLHAWLASAYPTVWEHCLVEAVGVEQLSLLITWQGEDESLDPLLFISHLDVVPVAAETAANWTHPPFSGAVADGYIWGRGALDVKIGVAGLLEAAELLLSEGWSPKRTIMFGFGQDEEVGGDCGAGATAALLKERGIEKLDAVIDEGTTVQVDGFQPYTTQPVALVATAEKGYYSVKVRLTSRGGHSSQPLIDHTAAPTLAGKLLVALDATPPSPSLVSPVTDFLRAIAPTVQTPWLREMFAHPERPEYADRILQAHLLVDSPLTAALGRTTAAVTGLQGYVGDNVLPPSVTVNVNFRLLPGDDVPSVMSYLQGVVGPELAPYASYMPARPNSTDDEALATPVTPVTGRHFAVIKKAIQETWVLDGKPVAVAPFLLTGGTDSKHYIKMSKGGVLRFVPTGTNRTAGDGERVHGLNERLSITDLGRAVCVYRRTLQLMAAE